MMKLIAIDENGEREEITDLYWFEGNGVHDFDGQGHWHKYEFRIETDDTTIVIRKNDIVRFVPV